MTHVSAPRDADLPHNRPIRKRTFLAGLAALPLLSACGAAGSADDSAGAQTGSAVSVTDMTGRTVSFDQPIERVITIPMPVASLFVAVDGGVERLVGMNPASKTALTDGVLGEFFPEAESITDEVSGTDFVPNVESILAQDPDVVIQWGGRGNDLIAPLEEAGIPVVALVNHGNQEGLEEWISILGTLLGTESRAAELITRFDENREQLSTVAADADEHRMMYVEKSQGKYTTANGGSYNSWAMELVGISNVAADLDNAESVSIEQILAWDPETVVLGNFDETTPQEIYEDPLWADVSAVKNRQVYKIPLGGYRWDPPSQESALMWRWLGQIAHPELDWGDLRAEIADWYEFLYDSQVTDAQIDSTLHMELNADSANYDAFAG